jgi:anti-sigma factor RsiW
MIGFGCWLAQRRLGAYLDGEGGSAVRARTAAHVERCAPCAAELASLRRLRTTLTATRVPEPGEAVWEAFWPQIRARLGTVGTVSDPEPSGRRARQLWESIAGHPRMAFGSAVAVAAVALLAVLGPRTSWLAPPPGLSVQPSGGAPTIALPAGGSAPGPVAGALPALLPVSNVVVQALETEDADSEVMVFANEEPAATVVWVFGLERT